jgi:hypothetical protein
LARTWSLAVHTPGPRTLDMARWAWLPSLIAQSIRNDRAIDLMGDA